MHEVFINGVKYIPAREVVTGRTQIIQGLLREFWGHVDEESIESKKEGMTVIVTDSPPWPGRTIDEVIDDIAMYGDEDSI